MRQNVDILNIILIAFRSSLEVIFGFSADAVCGIDNSNKKGDSKWCK
jgi:hypothetical protein